MWWLWWRPQAEICWSDSKVVLYVTSVNGVLNSSYCFLSGNRRHARNPSQYNSHTQVWQQTAGLFSPFPSFLFFSFALLPKHCRTLICSLSWSKISSVVVSSALIGPERPSSAYHPFVEYTEHAYLSPMVQNTNKPQPLHAWWPTLFPSVRGGRHEAEPHVGVTLPRPEVSSGFG